MEPKTGWTIIMAAAVFFNGTGNLSAQSAFKIGPAVTLATESFDPSQVRLLEGPFHSAMERNADYLLKLEPDRFLAWFRKEAGLEPKARVYGGWESQTIAGHCLGHYLSACAMQYAAEKDARLLERVEYIVDELAFCQKKNGNGYVAAIPNGKQVFAEVAAGEIRSAGFDLNGAWVPWYTLHKLMAGLRDAYLYCDNRKALTVLVNLSDWADLTLANLTDSQWQKMLACEFGGMNEILADVFALTGDCKYLSLAQKFYHRYVLDPLADQKDILDGLHANTQVPKVVGAARIWELTGDKKYKTIADFFWDRVVHHHSYVNGGNSSNESFGPPDRLNIRLHDTTETCNTYNMLKLTRHLFAANPKAEFMDYYERALINHIMAHQHPVTGMLMYKGFLDMPAQKHFCTPFDDFWCCTGTGMENHAKYNQAIYDRAGDVLYVNLFIASQAVWPEKGLRLRQVNDFPRSEGSRLEFALDKPTSLEVCVRKPFWCSDMKIQLNGSPLNVVPEVSGYIRIKRTFAGGDVIQIDLPKTLRIETMPDNPGRIAFFYGPVLLAADLNGNLPLPILMGKAEDLIDALKPVDGRPLEFIARGCVHVLDSENRKDLTLRPLYEIADQKYTVYMDLFTQEQWAKRKAEYQAQLERQAEMEARTVDVLRIGEMQPERDHNQQGQNTRTGEYGGKRWRDADNGGWFSFDMKVLPDAPVDLQVTYWGSESGPRRFDILIDGRKIAEQTLGHDKPNEFYDKIYPIPQELTRGKQKVTVRFQAHPQHVAGGLFDQLRILRR
jgi:hypothetical protein